MHSAYKMGSALPYDFSYCNFISDANLFYFNVNKKKRKKWKSAPPKTAQTIWFAPSTKCCSQGGH